MEGVEVEQVFFRYSGRADVLRGASLSVAPGEIVAVVGINGAGKTTLFQNIAGLLTPRQGSIRVGGLAVAADRRAASRKLAYVPDESLLYPELSALENLNRFGLLWDVPGSTAKQRGEAWLKQVALWEERNSLVSTYSHGMRQRLALGCALLHDPKVLLLDEPFNGLDMGSALALRELLKQKRDAGCAILFSSHQPETVDAVIDRLAVLEHGALDRQYSRELVLEAGGTAQLFLAATRASDAERQEPRI